MGEERRKRLVAELQATALDLLETIADIASFAEYQMNKATG